MALALFFAALIGGVVARLGINRIVGYIIAGLVVGPFTPGLVVRSDTVANLAELGLVFLLFSLGLSFSADEMREAGAISIAGNAVVMGVLALAFAGGAALAGLHHPWIAALTTVLSSTAIGTALLKDWKVEGKRSGHLAIGLLVVQDLFAIVLLVVVATPADQLSVMGVVIPLLKAIGFVVIALVIGNTLLHRVVTNMLANAPPEALFGACAAIGLIAGFLADLAGLPYEFGAFIAGAVISEAAGSREMEKMMVPFRALFVSLFFVAMGMLINPATIVAHWPLIVAFGVALVLLRTGLWTVLGKIGGLAWSGAALLGIALAPMGEFNIVLANAGVAARGLDDAERSILVGVTFFSIIVTTLVAPRFTRLAAAEAGSG